MSGALLFKLLVIALLAVILLSLTSGLFFLVRDRGGKERTAKALTVRIILSVALFALLFAGYRSGLIRPHGLYPEAAPQSSQRPVPPGPQDYSQ